MQIETDMKQTARACDGTLKQWRARACTQCSDDARDRAVCARELALALAQHTHTHRVHN